MRRNGLASTVWQAGKALGVGLTRSVKTLDWSWFSTEWVLERVETGAPCSPQRTWAENDFFECFYIVSKLIPAGTALPGIGKAFEGLRPTFSSHVR
jgi:hypothetical protein